MVQNLSQLAVLAVLARLLSPQLFGLASVATIVQGYLILLGQVGIVMAVIQSPNMTDKHLQTANTLSVLTSGLLAALVFVAARPIAASLGAVEASGLVAALSVGFFIQGFGMVHNGLLQRHLRFKEFAFIESISYVVGYGLVAIVLASLRMGPWAIVVGSGCQMIMKSLLCMRAVRQPIGFGLDREVIQEVLTFQGGQTLVGTFGYMAVTLDKAVVGNVAGVSALGIYARSYSLAALPISIFQKVVMRVLFSGASRLQNEPTKLAEVHRRSLSVVSLGALPLSAFLYVEAPSVVEVLLGSQWKACVLPFQLLMLCFLPLLTYTLNVTILSALGNPMRKAIPTGLYASLVAVAAFVGVKVYGVPGVAAGVGLAAFAFDLALLFMIGRVTNVPVLQMLREYVSGVPLMLLVLACTIPLSFLVRERMAPGFVELGISALVCSAAFALSATVLPRVVLGRNHEVFQAALRKLGLFNRVRSMLGRA